MKIIKQIIQIISDFFAKRSLIWELSKRNLRTRFAGSLLGTIWVFLQPLVTLIIFWFIFEVGFKLKPVENFPFILWLACGMIPWFFFADAIMTAMNSISENSYLVSKVAFKVSLLPVVGILSTLLVHIFFVIIIVFMFTLYGFNFDLYSLQLPYYLFALLILLMGLSWITSSAILFFKDIGQIVQTLLQFLFWGTPIFWSLNIFPPKYHFILKLNPLYYIISGYKECLIYKVWFWQHPKLSLYFWIVTLTIFIFGTFFFKKLKPHFGDVV